MKRTTLTENDVAKLLASDSGEARVTAAEKIAKDYDEGLLTDNERQLAEEIFRLMIHDAELRVRESLSHNLKENPAIPHEVALTLAQDVGSVALPVLAYSEVLTDADLIEIVRSQGPEKQVAIAGRKTVSADLSQALVDSDNEEAVITLVSNEGADIRDSTLGDVLDKYGDGESIQEAMVFRPKLPMTISERLLTVVSENFKNELMQRQELPGDVATDLLLQSRERATVLLSSEGDEHELERLISQMKANGRLTPSIVIRALCMGDMEFFIESVSQLAGTPAINVRQLVNDSGPLGLTAIYEKAGLPEAHLPVVRAAIDINEETEYDGGENDRERYQRRMIERILSQYGEMGIAFESDDLEYLLAKMSELPATKLDDT